MKEHPHQALMVALYQCRFRQACLLHKLFFHYCLTGAADITGSPHAGEQIALQAFALLLLKLKRKYLTSVREIHQFLAITVRNRSLAYLNLVSESKIPTKRNIPFMQWPGHNADKSYGAINMIVEGLYNGTLDLENLFPDSCLINDGGIQVKMIQQELIRKIEKLPLVSRKVFKSVFLKGNNVNHVADKLYIGVSKVLDELAGAFESLKKNVSDRNLPILLIHLHLISCYEFEFTY